MKKFPCSACGKCCLLVSKSSETSFLDRGDGVCQHFDQATHLCSIYENRPLVCRVEDYYHAKLASLISWEDFSEMNIKICEQLKSDCS